MSTQRAIHSKSVLSASARPSRSSWWNGRRVSSVFASAALVALTACSGSPAAPSTPTIQAAATQAVGAAQSGGATVVAGASPAAGTAVAAASPAAATAQAAAAPAAATIQAGAAPAGATAASVVGTAVGAIAPTGSPSPSPAALLPSSQTPLRIADASLADATPWLSIQNDSDQPVDVGGWKLQVGSASVGLPDDAVVQPGSALTIHVGEGMSSDDELYLGNAGELLTAAAQPGAPVRLTDSGGRVVTEVTVPRF
jgi:hypothetical protein